MYHESIIRTDDPREIMEFSHINQPAHPGTWSKENQLSLQNIKINIFIKGEFNVFVNGECFSPTYGVVCVLYPYNIHSGQILKETYTDYFQIDLGTNSIHTVPDGMMLIHSLITNSKNNGAFFRPSKEVAKLLIDMCLQSEAYILSKNYSVAYARIIEILSIIVENHSTQRQTKMIPISLSTKRVLAYIENNYNRKITVTQLAIKENVSTSYLSRVFKKEIGLGIHEYLMKYRITKAPDLLERHSVSEVSYLCGFSDSSHFISAFHKYFGVTPVHYKKLYLDSRSYQKDDE